MASIRDGNTLTNSYSNNRAVTILLFLPLEPDSPHLILAADCHQLPDGGGPAAKDSFACDNIALCLCRLWPWCMLTDQLREAVVTLLVTFTNNCPKGTDVISSYHFISVRIRRASCVTAGCDCFTF